MTPRVLLVGDFPPPAGGVATHVEELFRAVRARGGECEVLDIGKGQLPSDGVTPAGSMPRFAALLASFSARGFRIHLHTNGANAKSWLLASICAAAGRLARRPAMITLHSGLAPAWLEEKPARMVAARTILGRFGAVIAVNKEIRDSVKVAAEVVPAFSREFLNPGTPPPKLAALRAEASPLFCAMVAPRPEYGEQILLEAMALVRAQLPDARLALYGPGTERHAQFGFGELPRAQSLALIAACDVFVRPTLADGDSVSVREALALGRKVVATAVGNRPAEVRLVPPGDAAALARGLVDAAHAPSMEAAASEDGLQRILALYGFEAAQTNLKEAAPCAASAAS